MTTTLVCARGHACCEVRVPRRDLVIRLLCRGCGSLLVRSVDLDLAGSAAVAPEHVACEECGVRHATVSFAFRLLWVRCQTCAGWAAEPLPAPVLDLRPAVRPKRKPRKAA